MEDEFSLFDYSVKVNSISTIHASGSSMIEEMRKYINIILKRLFDLGE